MKISENKQKENLWNNLIKKIAITNDWKFKGWFAYKTDNNFFYLIEFFSAAKINSISIIFSFKPLIIDEVFWEIVDLIDNKKMPLSFRGNGAFVVGSKEIYKTKLTVVQENLELDLQQLFITINAEVEKIKTSVTDIGKFEKYVEQNLDTEDKLFGSNLLIMTSIIQQKFDKAISLIKFAKKNLDCSWGFGDKDFYDLAKEYCQRH